MLYNLDTEMLEIKVVWGNIPNHTRDAINEGRLDTKSFAIGEGVAGMAAKTKKPVRVNDRSKIEQVGRNEVYCILSVPLIYGGEVRGVMTLTNKVREGEDGQLELDTLSRFGEDDEQLLLSLADQAAANMNKAKLYNASITDRLTGLNNARHFESRFSQLVEQAHKSDKALCLAVTDIDHFKKFNDTYGHKAGDFVLQKTAQMLGEMVRNDSEDLCFRYGGEEFCMILPDTETTDAIRVMENYRKKIDSTVFDWDGQELSVSVSIGLANSTDYAHSISLFEAADKALYASKDNGRNQLHFQQDGDPHQAVDHQAIDQ